MFETPVKTFSIPSSRRIFTSHSQNISRIEKYQTSETICLMKDNFENSTFCLLEGSDTRSFYKDLNCLRNSIAQRTQQLSGMALFINLQQKWHAIQF